MDKRQLSSLFRSPVESSVSSWRGGMRGRGCHQKEQIVESRSQFRPFLCLLEICCSLSTTTCFGLLQSWESAEKNAAEKAIPSRRDSYDGAYTSAHILTCRF